MICSAFNPGQCKTGEDIQHSGNALCEQTGRSLIIFTMTGTQEPVYLHSHIMLTATQLPGLMKSAEHQL